VLDFESGRFWKPYATNAKLRCAPTTLLISPEGEVLMVKSNTMLARDGKAMPAKLDLLGVLKSWVDAGLRQTVGRRLP
jgi:hypothetical protein